MTCRRVTWWEQPRSDYSYCGSQRRLTNRAPRAGASCENNFEAPRAHFLECLPPFLGAGIRVKRLASDWKEIDVEMRLRWWNANYVGTRYGGSLYSTADPFFMVMLIENLGKEYIVWDKAASIRLKKPGTRKSFRQLPALR
jgi:hypothetical protein